MNMKVEHSGINAKWLKQLKTWYKGNIQAWHEKMLPREIESLEHYSGHGFDILDIKAPPLNRFGRWYSLSLNLFLYSNLLTVDFERKGTVKEPCFDMELATRIYTAHYLATLTENYCHDRCTGNPMATALGIVIGCGEPALQLGRVVVRSDRALLTSVENRRVSNDELINMNPIGTFIHCLLSDFLDEPPFLPPGEALREPICAALLNIWRDPDPKAIEQACLALCDFHTHVVVDPAYFKHTPLEILLLFKLRQMLGLENPQLDHPIMQTPLGKLPDESPVLNDKLLDRVRARMFRDGFDEASALGEDSEWRRLHKQAVWCMKPQSYDLEKAIAATSQALAIAETTTPDGQRVFHGLRALAEMKRLKKQHAESAKLLERALAIAGRNPGLDRDLAVQELAENYKELGRTADAEALLKQAA